MLNAALQNPNLTEAERLAQYKQSARYQAYQARMQAWQAEQERKHQAAMAVTPAPDWRAGLQALYEGRKAGEAQAGQKSGWKRGWDGWAGNIKYTILGGLAGMFGGGVIGYRVAGIPGAIVFGVAGGIAGAYIGNAIDDFGPNPVRAWFGFGPDNRGIRFVNEYYADSPNVSTTTATSIVMQHQWNQNPLENFLSRFSSSPSFGPAQISPKELDVWKASGIWDEAWDVNDPYYAAIAMSVRIQNGLDIFHQKCEKRKINCSPLDDLFVTAIVQNNGGMSDDQRSFNGFFSHTKGGIIEWHEYAAKPKKTKNLWSFLLNIRTWGQNYDTQFMIRQYYNDLMALHNSDPARWPLPEGITEQEMEYFRCVGQFKWPWEAKKCVRP